MLGSEEKFLLPGKNLRTDYFAKTACDNATLDHFSQPVETKSDSEEIPCQSISHKNADEDTVYAGDEHSISQVETENSTKIDTLEMQTTPSFSDTNDDTSELLPSNSNQLSGLSSAAESVKIVEKSPTFKLTEEINECLNKFFSSDLALGKCTDAQQKYILQYGNALVKNGNKPKWAAQVCASMVILYSENMEQCIPKKIDIAGTVSSKKDTAMRKAAQKQISQKMKSHGASYKHILLYIRAQRLSSWHNGTHKMRAFLWKQRQNPDDISNVFISSVVGIEKIKKAFPGQMSSAEVIEFTKSVAMYKAFVAITLSRVNEPNTINHENLTCSLQRGLVRRSLVENYPEYSKIKEGGTVCLKKNGIADSTSLGNPPSAFTGKGTDVHQMNVGFERILVLYFMVPEMCKDVKGNEHEIICDLINISAKIKACHN
ncbi:MAG: hypothetical protein LBT64_03280 [Puniceicoccales bacterium]|jgi:hypothetical protein|nr:hypothetical protein [Puniceicoccales bacterium]